MKRWLIVAGCSVALVGLAGFTPDISQNEQETEPLTYYEHIAPIVQQNCMGCHSEGGIGISFENPADLAENASSLAFVVENREMPPWMPGEASPHFIDERGLEQDEIDLIVAWATSGAVLGDPADMPAIEAVDYPTLREDLVLEMPEVYMPNDGLDDDYRCFLLDPQLEEDRYVTGYNVVPGQTSVVHHVLLFQIDESARADALNREAEDDLPGWQCFGGPGVGRSLRAQGNVTAGGSFAGSLGAWVPGALPTFFPEGTGALLPSDALIVMQVHYNLAAGALPDQTRAVLQFADAGEDILPLSAINMVAPVELPCPEGVTGDGCDRTKMISESVQVEGRRALMRPLAIMNLCDRSLDDYVHQDPSSVVSACDYAVNQDWVAVGVAGHMHELGTEITLELNPDRADAEILLHIPAWDFYWQGGYQFVEPVQLEAGDTLRITCVWDNSENDRYVMWGEGTADEMCLGAVTVYPVTENGA